MGLLACIFELIVEFWVSFIYLDSSKPAKPRVRREPTSKRIDL